MKANPQKAVAAPAEVNRDATLTQEEGAVAARICCLDLDTFFVSVERLLNPELIGKAVVVGGVPGKRGVVTAASYEVRKLGVRSGISMTEAVRLAPQAIFLPTRHGAYSPYAKKVKAILERYCPSVVTASIDEFFLDFSGCERLYQEAEDLSPDVTIERTIREMREAIQNELGLPASAGIGTTRAIAKIASGLAKPAGVLMVPAGHEVEFLTPLPVRKYPGIGPVAEKRLAAVGIHTLGQLMEVPRGQGRTTFAGMAEMVRRGARGVAQPGYSSDRPAFLEHDPEGSVGSISNERTFREDVGDPEQLRRQVRHLVERVSWRARKRGKRARTVTLKLRYSDFETISRSRTLIATHSESKLLACVMDLLEKSRTRDLPIRLIGVALSKLVGEEKQLSLPFNPSERPAVGDAIDTVRERFGYDAIRLGTVGEKSRWQA